MKLVTYLYDAEPMAKAGLVVGKDLETVVDVYAALQQLDVKLARPDWADVLGLVRHGRQALDALSKVVTAHAAGSLRPEVLVPYSKARLLSPIPRPPSMRDGYAFRQHVETARRNRGLDMIPEFDQFPIFYFTNHQAVIGPGPLHVRPKALDKLDFELEAAIVVGKECRDLTAANADEAIFGMMIMNDFSARTLQMEEMKLNLGPAKGKDFATGLGPWLVTMDELASAASKTPNGAPNGTVWDLGMRAYVNGEKVSQGNVKDMTWTFAQIMERASYGVTLYPGDVIGSGTCGTGCFLELNGSKITNNQWLKPGDVVALEIDRLGRLENTIVAAD